MRPEHSRMFFGLKNYWFVFPLGALSPRSQINTQRPIVTYESLVLAWLVSSKLFYLKLFHLSLTIFCLSLVYIPFFSYYYMADCVAGWLVPSVLLSFPFHDPSSLLSEAYISPPVCLLCMSAPPIPHS